jgi:chromosome transmission fidelity protein 1
MQPVSHVVDQLFAHLPPASVDLFSCGHIVPPANLLPLAVARGPTNVAFDFTFRSRATPLVMDELGRFVANVAGQVPAGTVQRLSNGSLTAL